MSTDTMRTAKSPEPVVSNNVDKVAQNFFGRLFSGGNKYIALIVFIAVFGSVGIYFLAFSHADVPVTLYRLSRNAAYGTYYTTSDSQAQSALGNGAGWSLDGSVNYVSETAGNPVGVHNFWLKGTSEHIYATSRTAGNVPSNFSDYGIAFYESSTPSAPAGYCRNTSWGWNLDYACGNTGGGDNGSNWSLSAATSASPSPVNAGGSVTLTYRLTNQGTGTLPANTVEFGGTHFTSSTNQTGQAAPASTSPPGYTDDTTSRNPSALSPGSSTTKTVTVTAPSSGYVCGYTRFGAISSSNPHPSRSTIACTAVSGSGTGVSSDSWNLTATTTGSDNVVNAGSNLTLTYRLTNTGSGTLPANTVEFGGTWYISGNDDSGKNAPTGASPSNYHDGTTSRNPSALANGDSTIKTINITAPSSGYVCGYTRFGAISPSNPSPGRSKIFCVPIKGSDGIGNNCGTTHTPVNPPVDNGAMDLYKLQYTGCGSGSNSIYFTTSASDAYSVQKNDNHWQYVTHHSYNNAGEPDLIGVRNYYQEGTHNHIYSTTTTNPTGYSDYGVVFYESKDSSPPYYYCRNTGAVADWGFRLDYRCDSHNPPAPKPINPTSPNCSYSSGTDTQKNEMAAAGINPNDFGCANYIMWHESGWCATKIESTHTCPSSRSEASVPECNYSGSDCGYGVCQSTPADKMSSAGSDWVNNIVTQLKWCNGYAHNHYGSWENAYNAWLRQHWW